MKKFLPSITSIITEQKRRILFAFDLDDTLIKTKANIIVYNGEETRTLTPAEYAIYEPQPGDEFDYSQFQGIKDPVIIKDTFELFSKILKTSKMLSNAKTIILTARTPSITSDLQKFLEKYNLPDVQLYAVGSSDPNKKAEVVQDYIDKGFNSIRFYDDSPKNITAVKALEKTNPGVQIQAKLMRHDLTEVIRKAGDTKHITEGIGQDYLEKTSKAYHKLSFKDAVDKGIAPNPNDVAFYISEYETDEINEESLQKLLEENGWKDLEVAEYQFNEDKYNFAMTGGAAEFDSSVVIHKVVDRDGKHVMIEGEKGNKSYPYFTSSDRGALGGILPLLELKHVKILKSIADIFDPTVPGYDVKDYLKNQGST